MQKDNKMGTMPVNKLLISMALPMMLSMAVQSLYNVVDSIFVSRISEDALTALSLAFPLQNMMISVTVGLGVGMSALMSRGLGEKNFERTNATAAQGIFLIAIGYLVFLFIGLFGIPTYMRMQTDIDSITAYGVPYLRICCVMGFGLFAQVTSERLLQSTGKTLYSMIIQMTGAGINIILDPILIFGYLGLPAMGVTGAAIATVIGQCVAALVGIRLNKKKNTEISVSFKGFKPNGEIIGAIFYIGIPSIVMMAIGSLLTLGINKILLGFTSTAVAVFGVYFRLQSFAFMPVFGINNGMVPIVAYNYGARKKDRMIKTIKLSILYAVSIMVLGFVIMQLFPREMLLLFDASENMMEIGIPALRVMSFSFLLAGYGIVTSSVFQALGNGIYSMLVSIARQLAVLLPVAYLFSVIGGLSLFWWAFPVSEVAAAVLSTILLIRINRKIIKKM